MATFYQNNLAISYFDNLAADMTGDRSLSGASANNSINAFYGPPFLVK
jgi:hypothetical protein